MVLYTSLTTTVSKYRGELSTTSLVSQDSSMLLEHLQVILFPSRRAEYLILIKKQWNEFFPAFLCIKQFYKYKSNHKLLLAYVLQQI